MTKVLCIKDTIGFQKGEIYESRNATWEDDENKKEYITTETDPAGGIHWKLFPDYFQEVKEEEIVKSHWKVGDYVVDNKGNCIKIFSVNKRHDPRIYNDVYTGQGYFGILHKDLRYPTEEELKIFFR